MRRGHCIGRALFPLLAIASMCSCGRAPNDARAADTSARSISKSGVQQLSFDGRAKLEAYLDAALLPDLQYPDFENCRTEAREFYESAGGTLSWIVDSRPSRQAVGVIKVLQNADGEGLNPIDYDGPRWAARLGVIDAGRASESEYVRFDLAITISAMRYVSDLHRGRVNPRELHFDLDIENKNFDLSGFLREKLVNADDAEAAMKTVEPPFPTYRRTVEALRTYMKLASEPGAGFLPVPPKSVKPGDSYGEVAHLRRLLHRVGDFPDIGAANVADSAYEGPLVAAVKRFQQRHGLEPNGILDLQTFKQLNTPLSDRVLQLTLTLERWRWLPHQFARPPIVVNIPEFRLYAANEEYGEAFSMKVVVGRSYKHQTPVFAAEVKSLIFRPYWNVPLDIERSELLPELRRDPNYLQKHGYEVVNAQDTVVSDDAVGAQVEKQLYSGKLAIRQRPGSDNALGLVKFDMPNPYDIYMHGTPATQLFSRSRRDFSHGCIRLEDPVVLAAWALRDQPEWNTERIIAAMNGDKTLRASLTRAIPVLILYGTAIVTEEGEIHFYNDIYGHDATLERALAKGYPYSAQ
ncbi:MAG: L,D-transpeptidase family protein [Candidatus Acidiferrales bacterium]|jgi:murein L,D-transpeptidase YcbB/YkuD